MAESNRDRDIVLAPNEFVFVMDETKAQISTVVSTKFNLSNTDKIVVFNKDSKKFEEAPVSEAIQTFVSCQANWYVRLTNPTIDGKHPVPGTSNNLPELKTETVILHGPQNFSLFPGQVAEVIQGHKLHLNQYLLIKVYDDSKLDKNKYPYKTGQTFIIKGTEQEFFMPVTGLEVIKDEITNIYLRNATTLQDLEYSILVSENGERRYVYGPAVVFPEPDEKFVINKTNDTYVYKAIELSDISGVYCKVIKSFSKEPVIIRYENKENDNGEIEEIPIYSEPVEYHVGKELFITGKDTNIFYPNENLAIISYGENKIIHHAIAIPKGEGRYVLNRFTGDVKMIVGPKMFLPDPRYEVIVKRKLSKKECELWYPGNKEVLMYNCPEETQTATLDDLETPKLNPGILITSSGYTFSSNISSNISSTTALDNGFYGQGNVVTDKASGFSRGNTYTKPRTITIDNKYDGVVMINVWTGYAVNVVGKNGQRKVIVGPQTYLLEYDETLEAIDNEVYIRVENAVVYDTIMAQTKDYVNVTVNVSYYYSFDPAKTDKWFSINNYKERLVTTKAGLIEQEIKKHTIEDFYDNATEIVNNVIMATADAKTKKPYEFENGMYVTAVNILNVRIDNDVVRDLLNKHQQEMVSKALELSAASKEMSVSAELARLEKEKADLEYQKEMHRIELESKVRLEEQKKQDEYDRIVEASRKAAQEAEKEEQTMRAAIDKIMTQADKDKSTVEISLAKERDKLKTDREKAQTDAIEKVIKAISPDLIAALQTSSKNDMIRGIAENLSPYALAGTSESAADVVNKLLRGTGLGLDKLIDKVVETKE